MSGPLRGPSGEAVPGRLFPLLSLLILALPASPALAGLLESAVAEIFNLDYCTGVAAGVRIVAAADLPGIHGGALDLPGGEPAPDTTLFVISRGDQPTPGYGFALADFQSAEDAPETARLTVNWRTPPRDAILPQVMTHPCVVVGLPRGSLRRIEVFDQHGTEVGSVDLPHRLSP